MELDSYDGKHNINLDDIEALNLSSWWFLFALKSLKA